MARVLDLLKLVTEHFIKYYGASGFGILFILCLLLLLLKKNKTSTDRALFWTSIIVTAVAFFPVSAWFVTKLIGRSVYWRIYWLFPVYILIAYLGTEAIMKLKKKGRQVLLAAACIVLIGLNGSFLFSGNWFEKRENNFKLPSEVIWVADAIHQHADEHKLRKKIVAPGDIAVYIRIYDASISQRYGRDMINNVDQQTELFHQINSSEPDLDLLENGIHVSKSRYAVLKSGAASEADMLKHGLELIAQTPSYDIYHNLEYTNQ